ncbi:translocation/assembly module TamB domain-containing protein [Capnocytophaga canis]|uniref:translocation/assembly module TamB domain-containing protein n=1 Tax=Capnocytophaga canis TaxID=1848903 RepID=UPI0037D27C64
MWITLLFFGVLLLLLALPVTQTFIAQKVVNRLNQDFDVDIQIEKIHLKYNGDVAVKGVLIKDFRADTLIATKQLQTSILNVRQWIKGDLYFGDIEADDLVFHMKTHKGDTLSNLEVFVSKFDSGEPSSGDFVMKAKTIRLNGSHCYISDENQENPILFQAENLNMKLKDFQLLGANVFFDMEQGSFIFDKSLKVSDLQTSFFYTDTLVQAKDMILKTEKTTVEGTLKIYPHEGGFGDFADKVVLDVELPKATISTRDLNTFYDGFGAGKSLIVNDLHFKGTLNKFVIDQGNITYQNTLIGGNLSFENLLREDKKIIIQGKGVNFESIYNDLATLMPVELGQNMPVELQNLGMFSLTGDFVYGTSHLDANLRMTSQRGNATFEGKLSNLEQTENLAYEGRISTQTFNIGALIKQRILGNLSADLVVQGKGTDFKTMEMNAYGKINSLRFNGYDYKKINIEGKLTKQLFNGLVVANDPNLNMKFGGLADFSSIKPTFDFKADIQKADLYQLKVSESDTISKLKGRVHIDIQGIEVDDIVGKVSFENAVYENSHNIFTFNDFDITSTIYDTGEKEIKINSTDIISGSIRGKYKMAEMKKIIQNALGSVYMHYNPYKIDENQYIDFNFGIYNKIVEVFVPELKIGRNTTLKGKIVPDDGSFKMQLKSPEINAFDYQVDGLKLTVDNQNTLYNAFFEVGKLDLGIYDIKDFNLISRVVNDTLFFRSEFNGGESEKDNYQLNFFYTLNEKQESSIEFKKSEINFRGNQWFINRENAEGTNKVTIDRKADTIKIHNFRIAHRNQHVNLSGVLTDEYKQLHTVANNVSLDKVLPELKGLNLQGTLNGHLSLVQKGKLYYPSSDVFIRNFRLNGYDYGDLEASIFGNADLSAFKLNAHFVNGKTQGFQMNGDIKLDPNKGTFVDVDAHFRQFNLAPFNPFLEGIFYDLRGSLVGDIKIEGSIENPTMNGELAIEKGGVGITYLNLNADINDNAKIFIRNQTFEIDDWTLTDTAHKTQALLNGSIRHNKLSDWFFDLNIKTLGDKFLVLNTGYTDDALFYGTGFINGNASIRGALDELVISVKAVTQEGTQFKIPLSDMESVGDDSFITFIEKENPKVKKERVLESVKGLELRFEMDVLPSTEVEIILDKKTGSNLVGTGAGTLLIEINTNGKFNMWGDFITYSGYYNFKFENLIDKRFTVLPGGSISWSGDPLKAVLRNLKAAYTLNANPGVLLESSQYNRKIATQVIISLEGELMQPEPVFDIAFPDSGQGLVSELNYRLEDKDRKQLQAFSLLAQGSFMSERNTDNRLVAYNLFETAAGLFNQLLSDEDNKLNLGVSYEAGMVDSSSEITNDDRLGFTISTQITDRVLFNGKVGIPVGGVKRTAVAGNGEVIFQLNPQGNLTAKVFVRENEWQEYLVDRIGYVYGTGITYNVDFNTFKELINKVLGRKEEE